MKKNKSENVKDEVLKKIPWIWVWPQEKVYASLEMCTVVKWGPGLLLSWLDDSWPSSREQYKMIYSS